MREALADLLAISGFEVDTAVSPPHKCRILAKTIQQPRTPQNHGRTLSSVGQHGRDHRFKIGLLRITGLQPHQKFHITFAAGN